jgi:hypothetical protein
VRKNILYEDDLASIVNKRYQSIFDSLSACRYLRDSATNRQTADPGRFIAPYFLGRDFSGEMSREGLASRPDAKEVTGPAAGSNDEGPEAPEGVCAAS